MGHFYYSAVKVQPDPDDVTALLTGMAFNLWRDTFVVENMGDVPTTPQDNRVARWCVFHKDGWDADFQIALLQDNRFEFKVPRSQWDESFDRQQRLRRKLVRHLNKAGTD